MKSADDSGSQSIGRAVDMLTLVAARRSQGARLSELAADAGLHIATARRILQALVGRGLLSFEAHAKTYAIGPAILSIAVMGEPWFARREAFLPALDTITRRTRDTVMFSIRSGREAVCLERREGAFPIRVMSLESGSRRPLGAGSGSLAILAYLSEPDRAEVLQASAETYAEFGLAADEVAQSVAVTRERGFAFNPGLLIPGVFGVAVPILFEGTAVAAVSVAAIESRMDESRRLEIVSIIADALRGQDGITLPQQLANLQTRAA